jgi:hypothetical protein
MFELRGQKKGELFQYPSKDKVVEDFAQVVKAGGSPKNPRAR